MIQPFGAVGGDRHDVLNAHAVLSRQVDAGLDAEGHPLVEDGAIAFHEVGIFVAIEADAVAGAVQEGGPIPRCGDVPAGDRIDLLCGDPRPHRFEGQLLRFLRDLVDAAELRRGLAEVEAARDVRTVTAPAAAKIDDQGVPFGQASFAGFVMGRGAVGPGADDATTAQLQAAVHEALVQAAQYFPFRLAGDGLRE